MVFSIVRGAIILFLIASRETSVQFSIAILRIGLINIELRILIDAISTLFLFTVRLISLSVLYFSYDYIIEEKFFARFHVLLIRFVLSIVILILANNLPFVIVG